VPLGGFAPLPLRLGRGFHAPEFMRITADLAAIVRTAPAVRITYTPVNPTSTLHDIDTQAGSGSAFAPTITYNGTGDVTLTFPTYWTDSYGVQWPISLRFAKATAHYSATAPTLAIPATFNRNSVRIFTWRTDTDVAFDVKTTVTIY